jgi:hypothetical protein
MTKLETKVRALFDAYAKRSDDALQNPPHEDVDGVAAALPPTLSDPAPAASWAAPTTTSSAP